MHAIITSSKIETSKILSIAIPIMVSQLAQVGMNVVDVLMAGNLSANDLAAVSVGAGMWYPVLLFLTGIMIITSSMIATANGARDISKIQNIASQAIYLGMVCGLIGLFYGCIASVLTDLLTLSTEVINITNNYLYGLAAGAPAIGLTLALRNYCEGLGNPRPITVIMLIGLIINIPLNYILIHGLFGAPKLGGAGCGWATGVVCWLMLAMLIFHIKRHTFYQAHSPLIKLLPFNLPLSLKMIKLGVPIGAAIFFECSLFSVVTLMISNYGTTILSGHEIAHNIAAVTFMIPLSVGMATTVRTGFLLGEEKPVLARQAGFCGIALALFFALLSSTGMILFNTNIAGLYTNNSEVIAIGALLVCYAAVFQFSDAIQVSCAGALRGYNDTRAAMFITFIAYWLVGLPIGYICAETNLITLPMGAAGYWTGTISGLTMAAILLLARYIVISRRHSQEIAIAKR